ncbi:MAG: hypothetical protein QOJ50_2741, partial [Cryptosporangiaceae bacterium]|nr:hypothetical protein [Cryptosporangiaceae bacterium]
AAGNDATSRPMFPAALGGAANAPAVPLVSVGALNPNGTRAIYSNEGPWVTVWAPGSAIISTFPTTFRGSRSAGLEVGTPILREGLDPDDYSGGFGRWTGTSFAAPVLAARLARSLSDCGKGVLAPVDPAAAAARVHDALGEVLAP